MPIYLLAEDEGNEEEILRLLESRSPGGSPCILQSSPISSNPSNPKNLLAVSTSLSSQTLHQEFGQVKGKSSEYTLNYLQ